MKWLYLFSLLFINGLPGLHQRSSLPASSAIEGVVVGKHNNPVTQAYIFVVKGEEETITGKSGKFALTTWQKFPISLSVEHPDYKKLQLVIKKQRTKQLIKLQQK